MLEKNTQHLGIVERLGSNGEGILKNDGYTVFVPFALPGEKIEYKILKAKDRYAFGKIIDVRTPAEERIRPVCSAFMRCGGCQLQHLRYSDQLAFKKKLVEDCFQKIAGISVCAENTVRSEKKLGYRVKLQLPIRHTPRGNAVGFFRENSHDIVPVTACPIQDQQMSELIPIVSSFVATGLNTCFDDETKQGLLRHFIAKRVGEKFVFVLVASSENVVGVNDLIDKIALSFSDFSFFINVNTKPDNVILGDRFINIHGDAFVLAEDNGIVYECGPEAFMQVNEDVRAKIYARVTEQLALSPNSTVIDAYSGAGLLTAMAAKTAKRAIGIECVSEAVACADNVKRLNNLMNMENKLGLCEEVLPPLLRSVSASGESATVILDPPRKGCDGAVIRALSECKPERIIYISCNPATLARDIGLLVGSLVFTENGIAHAPAASSNYEIITLSPYDMFPQTKHVETLICLSKKS